MPRKPKTTITRKKMAVILAGKIAGKPQAQIAAEAGVSRSAVSHTPEPVKAILREAAERNRSKLLAAYDTAVAKLHEDQAAPVYIDRKSAREELQHMMLMADMHTGLTTAAQQQGADGALAPVPMPELLQRFYKQTDRVIIERETHVNGHVNGNGKVSE